MKESSGRGAKMREREAERQRYRERQRDRQRERERERERPRPRGRNIITVHHLSTGLYYYFPYMTEVDKTFYAVIFEHVLLFFKILFDGATVCTWDPKNKLRRDAT